MTQKSEEPKTLGEKIALPEKKRSFHFFAKAALSSFIGALAWVATDNIQIAVAAAVACMVVFILYYLSRTGSAQKVHFLFHYGRQHFMRQLRISDKTVVFDGSNIYHFGLENNVGKKALATLISALRSEGYRIVCFFDANIFFTLRENGAFQKENKRFSIDILQRIFGLDASEVYVVPKGIQADRFVVETLSHLPISFAVTNDRFRDYETSYDFLTKDNQWRKGVRIQKDELMLYQHKFKQPLKM